MGKFSNWTFRDIEKFLKLKGFINIGARGSHYYFKKDNKNLVVVPMHGSRAIPIGTLKSIIRQSGIDESIWE